MAQSKKNFLAVDLGASSGRLVAGVYDGERLMLEEAHRFENGPVLAHGNMYWDILGLWKNVQAGLRAAATKYEGRVTSVGVDTWGVDFGLLGRGDELLGNPYHYRDKRTDGLMDRVFGIVSREKIFAETGLQFMQLNTLFQLAAMKLNHSPLLENAQSFLMMPDLVHWLMTGEKANEYTDASTSQLVSPVSKTWSDKIIMRLNLPRHIFGNIVPPGTKLGRLRRDVAEAVHLPNTEVVLPGTHDTASAVMAVPAASKPGEKPNWCYISSGTWSLMGVEVPQPVVNDKCRALNFTNEGGVGGTIRLLKNIAGLWLVQECRRVWKEAGIEYSWERLAQVAGEAKPLVSLVDPDHSTLLAPKDMPAAIREFCKNTGQPVPGNEGAVIRCALESLALRYRMVVGWLEELIDGRIETIHIVGGGTQNKLLCQMAADACGRRVVAGPVEATAIGNVLMQLVASGDVSSIAQAREIVRASFDVEEYTPRNTAAWDDAYGRFQGLLGR